MFIFHLLTCFSIIQRSASRFAKSQCMESGTRGAVDAVDALDFKTQAWGWEGTRSDMWRATCHCPKVKSGQFGHLNDTAQTVSKKHEMPSKVLENTVLKKWASKRFPSSEIE